MLSLSEKHETTVIQNIIDYLFLTKSMFKKKRVLNIHFVVVMLIGLHISGEIGAFYFFFEVREDLIFFMNI